MLDFLASAEGERLLAQLATEDLSERNTLALLTRLRRDYPPQHAGEALTLARLRQKAVTKFGPRAHKLFFTEDALQQASDPLVRVYRARRLSGADRVLDACCGIGADTLALAEQTYVIGVDIDPVRVRMAALNAAALGLSERVDFQVADVSDYPVLAAQYDAVFFDPARRDAHGKRIYDLERYIPPLMTLKGFHAPVKAAKLSPGVDLAQLEAYPGQQVEFISVEGDLKEAVLWFGMDDTPQATLLTASGAHHWRRDHPPVERPLSEPLNWLVEPDPSLIRAGLVQDAAAYLDGYLLDETIAYFTTSTEPRSPWVRAWRVLDYLPFNLKKLRAYLRERNIGRVTVKKRGFPMTPEELTAKLKLKGPDSQTLVATRCQGQPIVIICADYNE